MNFTSFLILIFAALLASLLFMFYHRMMLIYSMIIFKHVEIYIIQYLYCTFFRLLDHKLVFYTLTRKEGDQLPWHSTKQFQRGESRYSKKSTIVNMDSFTSPRLVNCRHLSEM